MKFRKNTPIQIGKPIRVGMGALGLVETIHETGQEVILAVPPPPRSQPILPLHHRINSLLGKDAKYIRQGLLKANIDIEKLYIERLSMHGYKLTMAQMLENIELKHGEEVMLKVRLSCPMMAWLYNSMFQATQNYKLAKLESDEKKMKSAKADIKILRNKRKAIAIYFLLKAMDDQFEDKHRGFCNEDEMLRIIARKLGVSLNTLKNRRNLLIQFNMAYYSQSPSSNKPGYFYLRSVSNAAANIGISAADVNYRYKRTLSNLKTFEYEMDLIWEQDKSSSMKEMLKYRIREPEVRKELAAICGVSPSSLTRDILMNAQINAFHVPDSPQRPYAEVLFMFNTNDHPGYRRLSSHYSYLSIGGLAYRKRKWMRLGLANIAHRQMDDQSRQMRPKAIYPTAKGYYSRPHKATMCKFTDRIISL